MDVTIILTLGLGLLVLAIMDVLFGVLGGDEE